MMSPKRFLRRHRLMFAIAIPILGILALPRVRAQAPIDICSVDWVDEANSVYEDLCIIGNQTDLYAENGVISQNSDYVPIVDSKTVLTDNNGDGDYHEGGFFNEGTYPQWTQQTNVGSGVEITPLPNDTYTLSGYYAECYDGTGQGGLGDPYSYGLACWWQVGSNYGSLSDGVSGYINPKYVVLGVAYVPPGQASYVKYANNTTVSNTSSIVDTFSSSYTNKYAVTVSEKSIGGWFSGSKTYNDDTTYAQSSKKSGSTTISKSASYWIQFPGALNDYQPNNHDWDVIRVWVNPVVLLQYLQDSSGNITNILWNGYGFNSQDQAAMEVLSLYVGCLNGDFAGCDLTRLNRDWDTHTDWPAGQGPALTATDIANILAFDPFWQCSQNWPPPAECQVPLDTNSRFTPVQGPNLGYHQPPPGGQPIPNGYSFGYTTISSQAQGYTTSASSTFGIDRTLKASVFGASVAVRAGPWPAGQSVWVSQSRLSRVRSQPAKSPFRHPT